MEGDLEGDPSDRQVWWRLFVEAVAGLQRGDKAPATTYLQFVEKHRGREVALQAQKRFPVYRDAPSWANCYRWINNGYKPIKEKFYDTGPRGARKSNRKSPTRATSGNLFGPR